MSNRNTILSASRITLLIYSAYSLSNRQTLLLPLISRFLNNTQYLNLYLVASALSLSCICLTLCTLMLVIQTFQSCATFCKYSGQYPNLKPPQQTIRLVIEPTKLLLLTCLKISLSASIYNMSNFSNKSLSSALSNLLAHAISYYIVQKQALVQLQRINFRQLSSKLIGGIEWDSFRAISFRETVSQSMACLVAA